MTTCDIDAILQAQMCKMKSAIEAYQQAEIDLASGALQMYVFDSGQTRTTVTKLNISVLRNAISALYNQYAIICNRLEGRGGGALIARPGF